MTPFALIVLVLPATAPPAEAVGAVACYGEWDFYFEPPLAPSGQVGTVFIPGVSHCAYTFVPCEPSFWCAGAISIPGESTHEYVGSCIHATYAQGQAQIYGGTVVASVGLFVQAIGALEPEGGDPCNMAHAKCVCVIALEGL